MSKPWNNLSNAGIAGDQPYNIVRRIRLQNQISLLVLIFAGIFFIVNLIYYKPAIVIIDIALIILQCFILYFNHQKKYFISSVIFYAGLFMALTLLCFFFSLKRDLEYLFLVAGVLPLIFYTNKKIIYSLFGMSFVIFVFAKLIAYGRQDIVLYLNYTLIFLITFLIVKYLKDEFETYLEIMSDQNTQLKILSEEKDQLVSIASHDLRSPLARIQGLLSLIPIEGTLTLKQREIIDMIQSEIKQQTEMIIEVLDLYSLNENEKTIKLEDVDVLVLLTNQISSFQALADKKNINILFQTNSESCICKASQNYLKRIFENILSNAIKFSYSNSNITISLRSTPQILQISFKDEGQGMDAEDQRKLFKRFQQLSAKPTNGEKSSGLGLSIAKKYVDAMNGTLNCESKKGSGTTFTVSIPVVGS